MLERITPPKPAEDAADEPTVETEAKGRGAVRVDRAESPRKPRVRKDEARPRTIYLPDPLFERIMVQAHRKRVTISEYVAGILNRQVPDYRGSRGDVADEG